MQTTTFPIHGPLGKFTWRMLATVLGGQSIVLFFGALVARSLAAAQGASTDARYLWVGSSVAVLSLLAAGLMRKPYGITLGWLVQLLTWLGGFVVPMMFVIATVFGGLWILALVKGRTVDAMIAARETGATEPPAAPLG